MEILVSVLLGALAGLIISVIFEEPLIAGRKRLIKWFRRLTYRGRITSTTPETFTLGKIATSWLVIDGDGELSYTSATIRCRIEDQPVALPSEVQSLRESIEAREKAKKAKGVDSLWNGPLYALERYAIGRTVPRESLEVSFTFRPSDYFSFQATVASLDKNLAKPPATMTLRQMYLHNRDLSQPIPFLAHGFGIALVIISGDDKILLARRDVHSGVRPGELDVSVVEGVHPDLDRSTEYRGPDLYGTAIRGASEEIGISLKRDEIAFLGFGVDTAYYQWGLLGVAHLKETAEHILASRPRGTGGKWELKKIEVVDADPKSLLSYLKQERIWATGLVAICWALVHVYGKERVNKAIKDVFG